MHILLVADGRSPIARHWAQTLLALNHEVSLVSTFPCLPLEGLTAQDVLPVAFGGLSGSQVSTGAHTGQKRTSLRRSVGRFRSLLMAARYRLGPLTLRNYRKAFLYLLKTLKPDMVHALRIPFEGMLAAFTPPEIPLIVSIWGNDLTWHAQGSKAMGKLTRKVLGRADGLMADARRDLRLAEGWGYADDKPSLVVPGSGGIDLAEIRRARTDGDSTAGLVPADRPLIINPRGFRPGSVRNDIFFQAIPLVRERNPEIYFACAAMQGQREAEEWVEKLHLQRAVGLLPFLQQEALWDLFLRAEASVSISEHDGTPNSLLEAMACGCLPIAGDIESIREWITPGVNGLLVEPTSPQGLAEAILTAVGNTELKERAAERNLQIIQSRAEVSLIRAQVEVFYSQLLEKRSTTRDLKTNE